MMYSALFMLLMIPSHSQTLDICTSGDCSWNDPANDIIPVCTNTATSCSILVENGHSGGKVYSAAPITTITCDLYKGCSDGEYHCGNELPPNYALYNLTQANFSGLINDCYFDCTTSSGELCFRSNFYCSGNVVQCRIAASGGQSLHDTNIYCTNITNSDATCSVDCPGLISCTNSVIHCTNSAAFCSATSNSDKVTIFSSSPTVSPTIFPTKSPTLPSSFPTKQPTYLPTHEPSSFPSKLPTNQPSYLPTNYPSLFPSNAPTKLPTMLSSYAWNETQKSSEYVTTDNIPLVNHTSKFLGMKNEMFFMMIGSIGLLFVILLILICVFCNKRNKKLEKRIERLHSTQSVISDDAETVDTEKTTTETPNDVMMTVATFKKTPITAQENLIKVCDLDLKNKKQSESESENDEDLYLEPEGNDNVITEGMEVKTPTSGSDPEGDKQAAVNNTNGV